MSLDGIVIGSGPNGLSAAAQLAKAGWNVLLLEAAEEIGGACRSMELTRPGFIHDIGAGFFPFGTVSKPLLDLDLPAHGVDWQYAPIDSCHPAEDGTVAVIARDLERTADILGRDGYAWKALVRWFAQEQERIYPALLETFPPIKAGLDLGPSNALTIAEMASMTGRGFSESKFINESTRRLLPSLALHTDVGPDDAFGAVVGFMLAMGAATSGFPVPKGGAGALTRGMAQAFEQAGGQIKTGARVKQILVAGGKARGVLLEDGTEIDCRYGVLANVATPRLYQDLLPESAVPGWILRKMQNYQPGFGTFKLDWALSGPVPWTEPLAREAGVVHAGDSNYDLGRFVSEVRAGKLPEHPYLVIGQQSIMDPTRAPEGMHTLYAYSRVPNDLAGGWRANAERFADRVDARIEALAPGFRELVLERRCHTPDDLEAFNPNLVGGDLGGGSADITNQLCLRPFFPYFRYRTPVEGLYLCSSYAHPGAGVHGHSGYNAAHMALRDASLGA